MNELIYLLQVVVYSGAFALVYRLLLAGRTAHYFNRRFLLTALVLPFVLPLLQLPSMEQVLPVTGIINMQEVLVGIGPKAALPEAPDWNALLTGCYYGIAGCLLLRLAILQLRFAFVLKKSPKVDAGGTPVTILKGYGPGSFNGQIFFPTEDINAFILLHERAHVRQRHHIDLWVAQLVKAAGWANPFAYYLGTQLKMVHEYEADAAAGGETITTYAETLLTHILHTRTGAIAHSFFHHPIKNRIIMLQKQTQSARNRVVKAAALVAIALFSGTMIVAQTAKPIRKAAPAGKVAARPAARSKNTTAYRKVDVMPEFKGDVSEWLGRHIHYPDKARNAGSEGRSIVQFVVSKNGEILDPKIVRGSGNEELDAESVRVVSSMPKWTPGKNKGRYVNVYFNLPITYHLE